MTWRYISSGVALAADLAAWVDVVVAFTIGKLVIAVVATLLTICVITLHIQAVRRDHPPDANFEDVFLRFREHSSNGGKRRKR